MLESADSQDQPPPTLAGPELAALISRVFGRLPGDRAVAILVDVPDAERPDSAGWRARRGMAAGWRDALVKEAGEAGFPLGVRLYAYRQAGANNADLPATAVEVPVGAGVPDDATALVGGDPVAFERIFTEHQILLAPTELSATAPLKVAARQHGFRAATLPGFTAAMVPALRLDYGEVDRRVRYLADRLTRAEGAELVFRVGARRLELFLDLRYRSAHVSSGLIREGGTAGNLPSGEAYIVPYEGERPDEPSRTAGELPVEWGGEVVVYRIAGNRVGAVEAGGPRAAEEAAKLAAEPAYGNLAELGLGVLAGFGVRPVGAVLLDEKLGLHVAFGRSEHFGGTVGPAQFSSPRAVIHLDHVYLPELMPQVAVERVTLQLPEGPIELMREGAYVVSFAEGA